MQHSYQDDNNLYVDETGNEFYDTVERLIQSFQSLDQRDNRVPPSPRIPRSAMKQSKPRTNVVLLSSDDERNEVLSKHRLQRSHSLNREASMDRGQNIRMSGRSKVNPIPNGDAFITIHDSDSSSGHINNAKPSPFVRGTGVRRTFSGISRPYFQQEDKDIDFDDNHSDNFRLVSHGNTLTNGEHHDVNNRSRVDFDESRSRRSKSPSRRRSMSLTRHVPDNEEAYENYNGRGFSQNGRSTEQQTYRMRSHSPERGRYPKENKMYSNGHKKPVEYVSTSSAVCFPMKKSKKDVYVTSKYNSSQPMPNNYGVYSDYDSTPYMNGDDSLIDTTDYDSAISLEPIKKTHRSSLRSRPSDEDTIISKHSRNRYTNYDTGDITNYSIGPEPRIRLTKEGYKFIELDVDVSGFRPEDIQIVTQGNLLQVIAKGTILKKGNNDEDTRIYRELKRQFSLNEVVNAEYLHGVLNPQGVLEIRGPVGVTGNTKKLKRKRVKFHLDS